MSEVKQPKSLYSVRKNRANSKNKNTITDADYFLRTKDEEDISKNTINMTPAPAPKKPRTQATKAE